MHGLRCLRRILFGARRLVTVLLRPERSRNAAPDEHELTQPEQEWPDLEAAAHLSLRVDLFSVSNAEIVFETSDTPDGEWQTVIEQTDFPGAGSTVVVALSREISRAQRTQRLLRWLRWRVRFSAAGSYISFRATGVSR